MQILIKEFDEMAPRFYNEGDRQNGYIIGKDRLGNEIKTGLLSISIGIVSNATRDITHVAQISEIGAGLKKYPRAFSKAILSGISGRITAKTLPY